MTTQEERMRVAIEMLGAERNIPLQDAAAKWERLYPADKEACFRMADVALSLPARVAVERRVVHTSSIGNGHFIANLSDGDLLWFDPQNGQWSELPPIPQPAAPAPAADPVREALVGALEGFLSVTDGFDHEQLRRRYSDAEITRILVGRDARAQAFATAEAKP